MDRRVEATRTALFIRTKLAIAKRLRGACRHLDPSDFDALVERMALVEIKYSMRRGDVAFPRAAGFKG